MLKPVGLASQTTATQPVTGISDKPLHSPSSSSAASHYRDYEFDQQFDPNFPVHPLDEEGKVPDEETSTAEQEPEQVSSEEQNYRENERHQILHRLEPVA